MLWMMLSDRDIHVDADIHDIVIRKLWTALTTQWASIRKEWKN